MKHINMNFTLRKTIRLSRQCLAKGNIRPLLRRNRLLGLLWMVVGGCFAALVILFALHPKNGVESYTLFKNISVVLRLLPPSVLFVYGVICLICPKFCGNYRSHYKKLEKTVRHNTGYPQKQYIPEEWEIPFTVYSPEALANILNLVGGWGQDNAFFLCNRVLRTTHRRHLEEAFLFNMCEKGIYLIPIGMDKGVPKAYADLAIVIPTESIKEFYGYDSEYPQSSSRGFTITTKCPMWDMFSRLFYRTDVMVFRVTARIHVDNAPFHDFNVNKLYQMYYVPYSYETIGYDPNKKKKGV